MQIILSREHRQVLINHAKKCTPSESCAILFGRMDLESCTVSDVFLAQNIDGSPLSFTISNEELLEAYSLAEKKSLDVVGIFHSHPSSDATPSSTDEKYMGINPVVWVIFSNKTGEMRGFIVDSEMKPETVGIVDG